MRKFPAALLSGVLVSGQAVAGGMAEPLMAVILACLALCDRGGNGGNGGQVPY